MKRRKRRITIVGINSISDDHYTVSSSKDVHKNFYLSIKALKIHDSETHSLPLAAIEVKRSNGLPLADLY